MNLLSTAYLLTFSIYIGLVIYILSIKHKSNLNRICALLIFSIAVWSFGFAFMTGASSYDEAMLWDNVASFGWCSFSSFAVWFAFVFAKREKVLNKWFFYLFIFFIPGIFIYQQWSGHLTFDYMKMPFGWASVGTDTFWIYLFYIYYISFILLSLFLYLDFWKKTNISYEKKQARIIFIMTLIPLLSGSITDALLPELGYTIPRLSNFIILTWAGGLVYAIAKYKLMNVNVAIASDKIISTMPDTLFLILPDTSIVDINNAASELTGYPREELTGKPVEMFLEEETSLFKGAGLERLLNEGTIRDYRVNYRTKSGESIPISFSASVIRDKKGNVIGIVGIGRDIREMLKMLQRENELAAEKARIKALEEARAGLEKMVEERTAALKKSYNELSEKTKTLERFQKITVDRELAMVRLKDEINTLLERLGQPGKYKSPEKIKEIKGDI
jgi:PAS domain S-box-containing protein